MFKHIAYSVCCSIFILLNMSSCEKKENKRNSIQLITHNEILVEEEATNLLYKTYPKASANDSFIAFTNTESPTAVILIDYEGKFIEQIGKKGKGPKELLSPRFKGFDQDGNIIVRDNTLLLIKRFSPENNLLATFEDPAKNGINLTSNNMEQCNNFWYLGIDLFRASYNDSLPIIGKFDNNFKLVDTIGNYDPFFNNNKDVFGKPIVTIDCKNNLLFTTHYKVPFIQIFDMNDNSLITRIDKIPESFKLSDKFIEVVYDREAYYDFLVNEQSTSSFLVNNEDYIMLIFRDVTSEYFQYRDLEYFNYKLSLYSKKDHSFLGETTIEGVPLGSTKEGYLITLMDDDPKNFRLRLINVKLKKDN